MVSDRDPAIEQCALWYWYHHSVAYGLYDSEEQAAVSAAWMIDEGAGVPIGAQFPDGRTVPGDEWAALAEARRRIDQAEEEQRLNPDPPWPTRTIRDPFLGREVTADADDPDWLGSSS